MNAPEDTDHKLEDLIATQDMRIARMRSAPAPSDPTGPLPVVGSGGMVGLRVESAERLLRDWLTEAENANWNGLIRNTYIACAMELRREMEAAGWRQPKSNAEGETRRPSAAHSH